MNRRLLFTCLLLSSILIFSIFPILSGLAQNDDYVTVEGDAEMIGIDRISGGGHITWTFNGEEAKELRRKIVLMYDNSSLLPSYFVGADLAGRGTGATFDGDIDESEANIYLEAVDRWLETSFNTGNRYRYYIIGRADTLYEEVTSSTEGLLNTAIDDNKPVVIKFIFNSDTPAGTEIFRLAETKSIEAIYDIFSVRMLQDFETSSEPFSSTEWRRTTVDSFGSTGFNSYWCGNDNTGLYENNVSRETQATIDLRFASYGNMSFKYRGSVADSNDVLDFTISSDGTTWYNMLSLSQSDNTLSWENFTFDFADNPFNVDFIGQKAYFRMNFTSDLSGNASGFFIDNIELNAPSVFQGELRTGHVDYIVGVASFSNPNVNERYPHIIRLLGGEVLIYSANYRSSSIPADQLTYDSFNAIENPAILFIIMFICVWFMVSLPNRFYSDYKLSHEPKTRYQADKILWLHWMGRIFIILTLLFYFFPTMFAGIGLNVFIGGGAMIVISIVFLVTISLTSKFLYDRKISQIPISEKPVEAAPEAAALPVPPPPVASATEGESPVCLVCLNEITDDVSTKCECGVQYHDHCASGLELCQACGRPMEEKKDENLEPIECPSCSEISVVDKTADLMKEKCINCGSVLKSFESGYNYLMISETPDIAFNVFNTFVSKKAPALCLSTNPKEKLIKKYNLGDAEVYWITTMDKGDHTLDPKRLDFEIMHTVSNFMKDNNGGVLMIDGVEYLIAENGFEDVSAFIKKVNDMASVNSITLLIPVNPSAIDSEKLGTLQRDFDKVETIEKDKPVPTESDEAAFQWKMPDS
jgi:hypothetical protein